MVDLPPAPATVLLQAACIADASTDHRPGALLLHLEQSGATVMAVGHPDQVARAGPTPTHPIELRGATILPGLVNAHTHLDLTHLGPFDHDPAAGLTPWLGRILNGRLHDEPGIAASVRLGVEKSLAGGVVAVGDIGGVASGQPSLAPWRAFADSPLLGVSFTEFFAIGSGEARGLAAVERLIADHADEFAHPTGCRLGLQPHAPYSVSARAYRRTIELARPAGVPLSTHLAESLAERQFVASAAGPQRDLLRTIGVWDHALEGEFCRGQHPAEHLQPILAAAPWLVAHVNDATDEAIAILARTGTSVAYCPRSSAYFAAEREFGPHRYQAMQAAGVNVCLGTDSIVNLDTPDRISVLDEMRLLVRRDGLSPRVALEMGTVRGARALGLDERWFRFEAGQRVAGLVAVDGAVGLSEVMAGGAPPRLLWHGNRSGLAAK